MAIIDLTNEAAQPMTASGRTLTFNGEVYNFRDLANELGSKAKGDTSLLLEGLIAEGPSKFLPKTNGMLAAALYDGSTGVLTLMRDRLGKKPLYTYRDGEVFAFASELTFFESLGLPLTLSADAVSQFRWLGYVPGTKCIYEQCSKFPAGCFSKLSVRRIEEPMETFSYWDPFASMEPRQSTLEETIDRFENLLLDATALRLEADVPVGAFLSGGIDSSIVAYALSQLRSGVTLYTVKAPDPAFDESPIAVQTARSLGMAIEVLDLRYQDYERQITRFPTHLDEPMGDSSLIPTMAIAELAARTRKVVLTGDGGDELFIGYPRLLYTERLLGLVRRFPRHLRGVVGQVLQTPVGQLVLSNLLLLVGRSDDDIEEKSSILATAFATTPEKLHDAISAFRPHDLLEPSDQKRLVATTWELGKSLYPHYSWENLDDLTVAERFAALDLVLYMRDDILMKVDRATMAYGLEARSPLLDHRMVEFALRTPRDLKLRNGEQKFLLREYARRRIGPALAQLPKKGFSVPLDATKLPAGPNHTVRWNRFVEEMWRENRDFIS